MQISKCLLKITKDLWIKIIFSTGCLYISPKISNCHLLWHSDFRFSKTWPSLDHLDLFEFIFCQEIWWLWWKPGELNLSMSAEKMIIVVYSQEMRGNLCLHCPKLPHPFSHKKCIHLDDNAWKKFLIFYKGRREDVFNPLFIQRSGFGW